MAVSTPGRRRRHLVLSVSALVVAAACGVENRVLSTGSSGSNVDMDTAVARFALASCDRIQACAPTFMRATSGTYDRCVERTKLLNAWIAELPGVLQTADFFVNCAKTWNDLPCEEFFSPFPIAACKQFGSRGVGDPCNFGDQCSSGFCKQTGYQCGTCSAQPAPGAVCQADGDCGEAQWCMPNKTCGTPSGLNQPCSADLRCRLDLTCSGGTCVASPASAGASCDGTTGLYCDFYSKGLYCTSAKTCAAAIPKTANQSCAEGGSYCERYGTCTSAKTCDPSAADNGGACDNDNGPYCDWPARCVAGACQLPTSAAQCVQ